MNALLLTCEQMTGLFTDFLEGALPLHRQFQVKTHLSLCPTCRAFLESLKQVPQRIKRLAAPEPAPPRITLEGLLKGAMSRIAAGEGQSLEHPDATWLEKPHLAPLLAAHVARCKSCAAAHPEIKPAAAGGQDPLGPVLRAMLPPESQWEWHGFGLGGARTARLLKDAVGTLFLIHLPKGARFPEHSHKGLEHAVLLEGVLEENGTQLHEGTVKLYTPGDHHAPVAKDEACWVLAHIEGEIRFSGWRRIFG